MKKFLCHVDASFDLETKEYGAGVYLNRGLEEDDELLFSGTCASSVDAEYRAVFHGLTTLVERGVEDAVVYGDCLSVMTNCETLEFETEGHKKWRKQLLYFKSMFNSLKFVYVPREMNRGADCLSKDAMAYHKMNK